MSILLLLLLLHNNLKVKLINIPWDKPEKNHI